MRTIAVLGLLLAASTAQPALGPLFFDPKGADFTAWINGFKNEIYRQWRPPAIDGEAPPKSTDVEFVVDASGRLVSARILRASSWDKFDEAALNGLKRCRFLRLPTAFPDKRVTMNVTFWSMRPQPDATVALRQLTDARFAANARNDRAFYEGLLAPGFAFMENTKPPQTKAEYLAAEFDPRPADYRAATATITDFRATVDAATAVASYRVAEPVPLGDQAFELRSQRLDTYARIGGEWKLVSMAIVELPSWPEVAEVDPKVLDEYAGTYRISSISTVRFTNESGRLMAEVSGQGKVELFPENATTFFDRSDSPYARIIFERDASGRVVSQLYRAQGQSLRAPRVE